MVILEDDYYGDIPCGGPTINKGINYSTPLLEKIPDPPYSSVSVPYELAMYRMYGSIPAKEIIPSSELRNILQFSLPMYDKLVRNCIPSFFLNKTRTYVKTEEVNNYIYGRRMSVISDFPFTQLHLNEIFLTEIDIMWYFSIEHNVLYTLYKGGLPVYGFYVGNPKLKFYSKKLVKRYRYIDILIWIMRYAENRKLKSLPKILGDFLEKDSEWKKLRRKG